MRSVRLLPIALLVAGCGGEIDSGYSVSQTQEGLTGCSGHAASTIPASGNYYLTSFGFSPSDDGLMSCGQKTLHGSWYYAASRQRYGCGARIQIEANGKCVVAETDDYGPDVCVENAAGRAIIDASPLVSEHLFGSRSAGWSDRFPVHVTVVAKTTALGPCDGKGPPPPPPPTPMTCSSATLDRTVAANTCVQSASDQAWYTCENGAWVAGQHACSVSYAWCQSSTLGKAVPPRTCVQSRSDRVWYQCGSAGWQAGVSAGAGPVGTCSAEYSL
jgi:hypothetical protein